MGALWSLNTSPVAAVHPTVTSPGRHRVCGGARSIPGCGCREAPAGREGIHMGRLLDLASIHSINPRQRGCGPAVPRDAVRDAGGMGTAGPDSQTPAVTKQQFSIGVISSL